MAEIPSTEAVSLFSKWERQNKNLAVLSSNSSAVVSARNAHVSLCLNDLLQLTSSKTGSCAFLFVAHYLSRRIHEIFPKIPGPGTRNTGKAS